MDLERLKKTCEQFRKLFDEHHQEMPEKHLRESFPRGCCREVSNTLGLFLEKNGFGVWDSVYAEGTLKGEWKTHVWLQKDNIVCDLTLDQFGDEYTKVFVGDKQIFHAVFYEQKPKQYSLDTLERTIYRILEKYMENKYPDFSEVEFWENEVKRYIANDFGPGDFQTGQLVGLIWEYFKYQWKNQSNYYFEHPLVGEIVKKFSKNVFVLKKDEKVFRARNFDDEKLYYETKRYFRVKNISRSIESMKESGMTEKQIQESIEYIKGISKYSDETKNKIESGFIGYDAGGSTVPPIGTASGGRCNMPGVAYLYTVGDSHTAIAEIRPRFLDNVSVATLLANRDLKLVDFYYNYNEECLIIDKLFDSIRSEFSKISKGDDGDYLVTRYIIDLIKREQYDGIRFKSSLVSDGINFVVFNPNDCRAISSNLYQIQNIKYDYDNVIVNETF